MSYRVAVRRKFIAQHYLIGGDWGPENELHSHAYAVEVQLEGPDLDVHGYLVDIVEIEAGLEEGIVRFADRTLNDQPEFAGLNPSIEHFSRILCEGIQARLQSPGIRTLVVKLWENDDAWASYQSDL